MPLYGLASLPLIRKLNIYADDSCAGATFNDLEEYVELLKAYSSSYVTKV